MAREDRQQRVRRVRGLIEEYLKVFIPEHLVQLSLRKAGLIDVTAAADGSPLVAAEIQDPTDLFRVAYTIRTKSIANAFVWVDLNLFRARISFALERAGSLSLEQYRVWCQVLVAALQASGWDTTIEEGAEHVRFVTRKALPKQSYIETPTDRLALAEQITATVGSMIVIAIEHGFRLLNIPPAE